jgi:hypothetical protein
MLISINHPGFSIDKIEDHPLIIHTQFGFDQYIFSKESREYAKHKY